MICTTGVPMTRRTLVRDVMTNDVVTVGRDTDYQKIAELLLEHDISAVPVVDADRHVLGLVSEADLMAKVEFATMWPIGGQLQRRRQRDRREVKARGDSAGELMTADPITIDPQASLATAARTMADASVKRLPVVDPAGRLVGLVSRRDLLRTHLRTDAEIRSDVAQALRDWFHPDEGQVDVAVTGGVVTLSGQMRARRQADLAIKFASARDGVVDVVDALVCPTE